ncbi:cellulase [Mycena maculata]|uniref:Cellulase n=1 Tax=Mycena maculata TaxID=230809 RepID=A0AAD7IAF9_9AGAR|nr:cellulase [Mycena maculata]
MLFSFGAIALWLSLFTTVIHAARRDVPAFTPPLSTRGRYVVDVNGNRFKMLGGNWHGASGTWTGSGDINDDANHHSGENAHTMPLGLRSNPQFIGMTCLEVYDAVVAALAARGFAVILNNMTNLSLWCCGVDGNERWDESQTYQAWVDDWVMMAARYQDNKYVIGADLYNEVRRDILTDPDWGNGDGADWQMASQLAGDLILTQNPDILVIVEGINWVGLPVNGLPHNRPTLIPVGDLSHTFVVPNKLIYSAHFYSYTGPANSGASSGLGSTSDPTYADLSQSALWAVMNSSASYVALTEQMHYTAPVWISEFGVEGRADTSQSDFTWWQNMVEYLVNTDAEFAFWPLVGYLNAVDGTGNGWSLMNWDPEGEITSLYDTTDPDWREPGWTQLVTGPAASGQIDVVPDWKMLTVDHGDFVQSAWIRANVGDFDNGAYKAVCPDNLRLIGLSQGARGLCTDVNYGSLWNSDHAISVVQSQVNDASDWASGFTKYTCPAGYFASGYSVRGAAVSSVLCAHAGQTLGTTGRTVWFNQGDNRWESAGEFAYQQYKGSCTAEEYVWGVAFTTSVFNNGSPAALLCVS